MDKLDCKSFRKHLDQMLGENDIDTVVVLSHVNADGDAAGSVLSLSHYLNVIYPNIKVIPYLSEVERGVGKIVLEDEIFKGVFTFPTLDKEYIAIAVDTATEERIAGNSLFVSAKDTIQIDHHLQNEEYADVNYIEFREACAENIYSIIDWDELLEKGAKTETVFMIAQYLYLGIVTDTGCFKRSDKITFDIASHLLSLGVEHKKMVRATMSSTMDELRRQNSLIDKVKSASNGDVTYVYMKQDEMCKRNYTYHDLHKLPDLLRELEGVKIAFVFFPEEKGLYKCSMRSKEHDINEFLSSFIAGGGGHRNAASFKICTDDPDTVLENLLDALESIL